MKRIGLLALAAIFVATAVHAGEPARGKVCDCDPEAFGRPTGAGLNNGDAEASNEWALGGNTSNRAAKVRILDVGTARFVSPDCRAGRETQVFIEFPDGGQND